jgi:hypothetical protein
MVVDERRYHFHRRSSSACAKNADAFAKNLVRPLQFEVLAFEPLQALAFIGRQPRPLAGIALGLAHSAMERLDATPSFSPTDRIAAHGEG